MLRIGLLGCGRIGQVHGRTLKYMDEAQAVAVADAVPAAAEALAADLGATAMNADALIESANVDAVVIGTPTDTHFDLIHKAAAAGKAIFCEKPIDMSVTRIRRCLEAVDKAGVPFMTAFQRRFDPSFAQVKARIDQGVIGDVEMLTILSRDPAPPPLSYITSSGGIFRDMMIHDFDMARFLLGEEPVTVYAAGSSLVDPAIGEAGDVDTAMVTLKTVTGKLCQISNSRRASYGYDQRLEVHGSAGMLRADNHLENQVELANMDGFARAPAQHFFLERYTEAYRLEMAHFVEAVISGSAPSPGGEDGLRAQAIADAATLSWREGGPKPVTA